MDQVFAVRQVCEKYLANGKMYHTIDRHGMWQMQRMYEAGRKLLKAVQRFYVYSRVCVRMLNDMSVWFSVNVGLRQGCVMSP